MILTHIDLKYVSLIYRKIHQKVPNGKGLKYATELKFLGYNSIIYDSLKYIAVFQFCARCEVLGHTVYRSFCKASKPDSFPVVHSALCI